jgi:hypothetical protein
MALADIGQLWIPPPRPSFETNGNHAGAALDGTTVKRALIFQIPATGTLDKIVFRTGSFATPQTLRVSVQNLGGDGLPDGTYYGSSSYEDQASPGATTTYTITLTTPATGATKGDFKAVVIEWAGSPGAGQVLISSGVAQGFPTGLSHNGSVWSYQQGNVLLASVGYSSTYYNIGRSAISAVTTGTFKSDSTGTVPSGDERGNKFVCPATMRVIGAWFQGGGNTGTSAANYDIVLYETDATTVRASVSLDGDYGGVGAILRQVYFASPYTLAAGSTYYITLKPTQSSANCALIHDTVMNLASLPGGTAWSMATCVNSGTWSESTDYVARIGLIVDKIDDGAGGGGGSVAMPVSGSICA